MREKHPIDERFNALYDAEVSPPDEVRDALAQHLGWDPGRATGSPWRSWLLVAAGAALAVTSALYLGHQEGQAPTPSVAETHATIHGAAPGTPAVAVAPTSGTEGASGQRTSAAATTTGTGAADHAATSTTRGTDKAPPKHDAAVPIPAQRLPQPRITPATTAQYAATTAGTTDTAHNTPSPEPTGQDILPAGTTHPAAPVAMATDLLTAEDARWMQHIPLGDRTMPEGSPLHAPRPAPYVLPAAQWWLGAYAGAGKLTGEWRGPDSEAMNAAEGWRGSTQWGLLFGRRWRSGWSASIGAGLGLTRSTFAYDEQQWERFMDVDTNWTQTFYNNTLDVVYTWSIDSMAVERPGAVRSTHARNVYGALQIPLTAAWHGTMRRWHYGAFGGVTLWIPTQREGSTLYRQSPDAQLRVVGLRDAVTNMHFGPRLNAHAGLSLGFALTETFSVFAEPMMTMPASTFGKAGAPRMTGHFLQLRLQHEFSSR